MRWFTVSAALLILSAASQVNAGLFDCCKKEPACCCPAPTCCNVEPSCCAPAPTCCHVAPTCCAPAPVCHQAPSCHVPEACCDSCGPVYYEYCPPKKKCCLCKLWDMEKRKNRWLMSKMGW